MTGKKSLKKKISLPLLVQAIEGDGSHLFIDIVFKRKVMHVLVDTGASKTVFSYEFIRKYLTDNELLENDKPASGVGTNTMKIFIGKLNFRMGELHIKNHYCGLIDFEHITAAYKMLKLPVFQGIIGGDLLMKYKAVINYKTKELILEQSVNPKKTQAFRKVSWLEFIAVAFGLWAVVLSAREKILTWPVGLVNIVLSGILFYRVQLYSDVFLYIYFFITGIYGWWEWSSPQIKKHSFLPVTKLSDKWRIGLLVSSVLMTLIFGYAISKIHLWLPSYFEKPAAFPYIDTLVMVLSIIAQLLLARKKIENWILWIFIDAIGVVIYFLKDIKMLSAEYFIFMIIALFGYFTWAKSLKKGVDGFQKS